MQRLDDQRAARVEEVWRCGDEVIDDRGTYEGEIGDDRIEASLKRTARDLFILCDPEVATRSRLPGPLDQLRHDVHACDLNAALDKRSSQPPFATPDVERSAW